MWSFLKGPLGAFPYDILDSVLQTEYSIWKQYSGKKKNGEKVSIFICEERSATKIDLAKTAIKRLKTLRHPSVLTYIDSMELNNSVYLVTEAVSPLFVWMVEKRKEIPDLHISAIPLGLLHLLKGLSFMCNDAKLIHGNLWYGSIYVTDGGEWKLFGLEYATADLQEVPRKEPKELRIYDPPEIMTGIRKTSHLWSADSWGLGCVLWELFNDDLQDRNALKKSLAIPKSLVQTYTELTCSDPLSRPNPQDVLKKLRRPGQFLSNDLIETLTFLEEIQIKDDQEKQRFLSGLASKLNNIPHFVADNKILPELLKLYEYSNVGSVIMTPLFKIGSKLLTEKYRAVILPCVVRMFSSPDRSTRLCLLQQMETMVEHLDSTTLNDHIFEHFVTGFQDTNPTIRENTVKAVLWIAPKLNSHNLNVEIMKHFARLQSRDDQGGIRTNTTVCLSKIAPHLDSATRQKCLASAFTRAMRDTFPPARISGVTAVGATQQFYPLSDVASKLLPALSQLTLDPDKSVRTATFKILKGFIGKLEKVSEDPELRDTMEKEVSSASVSVTSSWTGWAVGALTSKFYKASVSTPSRPSTDMQKVKQTSKESTNSEASTTESSIAEEEPIKEVSVPESTEDTDGWDDEEWGSLEVPIDEVERPNSNPGIEPSYNSNAKKMDRDDFFAAFEPKVKSTSSLKNAGRDPKPVKETDGWGDDWGDPFGEQISTQDDAKKEREEKKIQRQKEIQAKRAARSGPMKLGVKKT